jgi:hypothetical protein
MEETKLFSNECYELLEYFNIHGKIGTKKEVV